MRIDLHVHSSFSPDAIASPAAICRAALRKGLDGFALTDHDTTAGWDSAARAAESAGLLFVRGQERRIRRLGRVVGEVLCLFLCRPIRSDSLEEVLEETGDQGGLVVAAHPFDLRRPALGRSEPFAKCVDRLILEVLNGRGYGGRGNRETAALAEECRLPVSAGSDAHTPFEVGAACVEADVPTLEDLAQAIRVRGVRILGHESLPLFSAWSGMRKLGIGRHRKWAGNEMACQAEKSHRG